MLKFDYFAPKDINEAVRMIEQAKGVSSVKAGGTDLLLQIKNHKTIGRCWACRACTKPACPPKKVNPPQILVGLKGIKELRGIETNEKLIRIKSCSTLNEVLSDKVISQRLPVLHTVLKLMGSVELRNLATVGGNICNADPLADLLPVLLAVGSSLKLYGSAGEREIKLQDFLTTRNKVKLAEGEIMTEIIIPDRLVEGTGYKRYASSPVMGRTYTAAATFVLSTEGGYELSMALSGLTYTPVLYQFKGSKEKLKELDSMAVSRQVVDGIKPINVWGSSPEYLKHLAVLAVSKSVTDALEGARLA